MTKKYNSINDQYAQSLRNNQNTIEILTKFDQSLNSSDSFITVTTVDSTGKETTVQVPTIGYFKQTLDRLSKTVRMLSGVDGNPAAIEIANNQFKRIVVADLNLEPKPIANLSPISTFKQDPNWIFDAFLNPKISIELDLTDKIPADTRTIESKRFIVEFDKSVTLDANGDEQVTLTTNGALRKAEFELNYKGKSDIDIVEFVQWLDSLGLVNRLDDTLLDQDYFRVEPNRLQTNGNFTVVNTETDILNRKLWYILDTLTYYNISDPLNPPTPVDLKVGDLVNVNPNVAGVKSTTVYKVVEISTITSEFRVRFELVYGEEPISPRLNALSIYSEKVPTRKVKVSVGFDEYCVVFLRPVDDTNNLIGQEWSPGVGFWTNELRLDNENGELFSDYYIKNVYDYGLVIEDLVQKKVPNYYGIKPTAPVLTNDTFKVVQTNQHLTNSVDAEKIRDLHNSKNSLISEIQQIQEAIDKQNRMIQTTVFESQADRKRAEDELTLLDNKLKTKNATKFTIVQDILASRKNLNKIDPKFRVRGFWPMPDAVTSTKTTPQEVVQFEVWYRKLSKSGSENPVLTVPNISNSAARTSDSQNTTVNSNLSKPKTVSGSFSNWTKFKTDARKRTQDPISGQWLWVIEDVTDANTPNINQLDIDIMPGERIEIKIKSLSEVGWPETPIESDFSELLTVDFPDDLNNVVGEDQFILKEAQADDLKVSFERDLEARGLGLHLNSSIRIENVYYAHRAEAIASGFKDDQGQIINLYDQLLAMSIQIAALEEQINKAKGLLEVYLVNKGNRVKVFNGNSLSYSLNLEDYMTATKIGMTAASVENSPRTYKNELMLINDFSLLVKNAATDSTLGLLSNRGYGQPNGLNPSTFTYTGTNALPIASRGIQAQWIQPDGTLLMTAITSNSGLSQTVAPQFATQQNNQWLWLQIKDLNGNYIYDGSASQPGNNNYDSSVLDAYGQSFAHAILMKKTYNLGWLTGTNNTTQAAVTTPITLINDPYNWEVNEAYTNTGTFATVINGGMASTIMPVITGFTDITDTSSQLVKLLKAGDTEALSVPINIYAKPYTGTGTFTTSGIDYKIKFDQTAGGGDMPTLSAVTNVETVAVGPNNFVTITFDSTLLSGVNSKIVVGDKMVFSGFTTTVLLPLNNIPLTVTAVNTGTFKVQTSYKLAAAYAAALESTLVLEQIHKKIVNTDPLLNGPELTSYNVLGTNKYVDNYIVIANSTINPAPIVHSKKLRFYLEDENNIRPFEFQLNWDLTQYKRILISMSTSR